MAKLAEEEYENRCDVFARCEWCGKEILLCDTGYYDFDGDIVCTECVDNCRHTI